jgi:O-acetyl-ADP-ribose deacetylase (regulator of RNase III)
MNRMIKEVELDAGRHLQLVQGDITEEHVEAIVNAANAHLQHGGGVAKVIALKGGHQIQRQSNAWVKQHGPVSHEVPAITGGGNLPCRYVIHAVGPVWGEGDEEEKLGAAIRGALQQADQLGITSIAFPAISTGIFGFPKAQAAKINFQVFMNYFHEVSNSSLDIIRLTLFDQESVDVFDNVWEAEFGATGNT